MNQAIYAVSYYLFLPVISIWAIYATTPGVDGIARRGPRVVGYGVKPLLMHLQRPRTSFWSSCQRCVVCHSHVILGRLIVVFTHFQLPNSGPLRVDSETRYCLLIICGESFKLELESVSEPAVDSDLPRLLDSNGSPWQTGRTETTGE